MPGLDYFIVAFAVSACAAIGAASVAWAYRAHARIPWAFVSLSVATWSVGYVLVLSAPDVSTALRGTYVLHAGAIAVPVAFTYFVCVLTKQAVRYRAYVQTLTVMGFIFEVLNVTPLFITGVSAASPLAFVPDAGPLYIHFTAYFFAATVFAWYILFRAMRTADTEQAVRYKFLFVGSLAGAAGFAGTFPMVFGADVAPWSVALVALYPLVSTYVITRRKGTTSRMVASELFIIILWYIFLMRTILSDSLPELVLEIGVLGASVVFGVLLIRNVHKETEIRERGERLARYLANANARLRELDKQKTEFVSLASHQLRGPIAAIVGYVSLVQEGSYGLVPDHLKEPLSRIFESGKRISLMVDDFLNVTRIEQGRMSYRFVTCDIAPLVSHAVEEFRVLAEKKGLAIMFVPSPDGQVLARVDETKFVQVLQNLIDNAVKFTVSGSITVSVRSNERKTKALVTVADTGIGIAPEEVHNLSHKFSRASNANSVSVYGSGLGLYISKEILKAHDGWIYISSAGVGKGSVFTVELPIERGEKME